MGSRRTTALRHDSLRWSFATGGLRTTSWNHDALQKIEPRSRDFALLQRQYFLTAEKYLDTPGDAAAPFHAHVACRIAANCIQELPDRHGWDATSWVIMPNHLHLLLRGTTSAADTLRKTLTQLKGRSARLINQATGHGGEFWQSEWCDRWARTETEETKIAEYIRQNPVKARIVSNWKDYEWVP